jgi:hypothetical protein
VSKEIATLLITVATEDTSLVAPPTLLGVVLPECVSLGFGENRFNNCVGGDMKCVMICPSCQNNILTVNCNFLSFF